MKDPGIDILVHGSHLQGRSSAELGWEGVAVERRVAPPTEWSQASLDRHYALLWCGQPTLTERQYRSRKFTRMMKQPGTLSMGTAGCLPSAKALMPFEVVACVVDPRFAERLVAECDQRPRALREHLGIGDPPLASLIGLASQEANDGGPSGKLYADSLCVAIVSRFLHVAHRDTTPVCRPEPCALPPWRLRRVLEKIEAEFCRNLSLDELAVESGYSRAHFLRMFRAATGKTPHRYLQDFRLDQARRQLVDCHASLADIAVTVGFSSHSHFSRLFRQVYGTTPADYRRDIGMQTQSDIRLIL